MAALNRPANATYEVHESVKVDTSDNEDHTFCGIMFPIKAKTTLPVDHIVIHSVAIRGQLGPMTVWVTNEQDPPVSTAATINHSNNNNAFAAHGQGHQQAQQQEEDQVEYRYRMTPRHWTKVYDKEHAPSPRTYQTLTLDTPIVIKAGKMRAMYIHSTLEGDEAIVYDNSRALDVIRRPGPAGLRQQHQLQQQHPKPRYEDARMAILSGKAHLSNNAFGQVPIWGWGNAWRDHREFVGQLEYGVVYKLWQPERSLNCLFGDKFQKVALRLLACQRRNYNAPATCCGLPDECVFYILNMCRWDWFDDSPTDMKIQRRLLKRKRRMLLALQRQQEQLLREQAEEAERQRLLAEAAAAEATKPKACNKRSGRCAGAATAPPLPSCGQKPNQQQQHRLKDDANYDAEVEHDDEDDDEDEDFEDGDDDDEDDDEDDEDFEDEDDDEDSNNAAAAPAVAAAAPNQANNNNNGDDDDDSNESEWERANGYRADGALFTGRYYSSDEEEEDQDDDLTGGGLNGAPNGPERQNWISRNLARIHVLRALAGGEGGSNRNNND